jgi:hypothetical protein
MLSHASITHLDKDCPLYNRGTILPVVDALKKRDDLTQKHSITLYWMVSGAPEHVRATFLKATTSTKSHSFLHEVFVTPSAFKITPVQMMKEINPVWSQWERTMIGCKDQQCNKR